MSNETKSMDHRFTALMMGAIGVVYGDIGTSVLYTLREVFSHGLPLTSDNVLGILSLIVWSLMIVVTLKYVLVIMRADNKGQGGVLALSALAQRAVSSGVGKFVVVLGMLGTALFVGDSLITPAISVLSAVEGVKVAAPALEHFIVPISITVIGILFYMQKGGTEKIGKFFGPIMCAWFATLGLLGCVEIFQNLEVLKALSPTYAVAFFANHGFASMLVLGSVVLAVTGGEALYADMGHFGRRPIQVSWIFFVLPCLLLNYFGQGALVLANPEAVTNPFYLLAPSWATWPLMILATAATVIASQAVISGAFSITQQAVQMGYLPRREIRHTSDHEIGQVYIPRNNWVLFVGVVVLILGFQSSDNLASAYGISVVGAMTIDAILAFVVAISIWKWKLWYTAPLFGLFIAVDLAFLGANSLKFFEGGWFPLLIAAVSFTCMYVWRAGRKVLFDALYSDAMSIKDFINKEVHKFHSRTKGCSVFMTGDPDVVPAALLHNIKHNYVLHERVVLMTVKYADVPYKRADNKVEVEELGEGFWKATIYFGFMEKPDVPSIFPLLAERGLKLDMLKTSFFVGRETLIPSAGKVGLPKWQEPIFIALSKTASSATEYFSIPCNRVVELGTQVEI